MTDTTTDLYHSIANPPRTTLMNVGAADAAAPHHEQPAPGLTLIGADDAAVCVDGVCALPD